MPRFATHRPAPEPTPLRRTTYGHTWWGGQWLQALTQIDHEGH
jgi:hypothetical protein